MPNYFRETRNVELSLLYYLETNLATDWVGTTVAKTFKQVYGSEVNLPIVLVRLSSTNTGRLEVGSNTLDHRYLIIIDIYARSDAQRLDLADYIKEKLKDGWAHFTHSHVSGDQSSLFRTANGRDWVTSFVSDTRVDFVDTVDTKDKYRQNLSFLVRHTDA